VPYALFNFDRNLDAERKRRNSLTFNSICGIIGSIIVELFNAEL
jgi:hypothetical protein